MSEQSQLPGFEAPSGKPTDRLFLAVMPDVEAITRMQKIAQQIKAQHGLTGKPIIDGRLHITLIDLDDQVGLSSAVLDAISRAAATVSQAAFDVVFDQVELYPRTRACFLKESVRCDGFTTLKQSLAVALKTQGVPREKSSTPHVTLLYDTKAIARQSVEPIAWTVKEFALVHSHLDKPGLPYNILARWPLG